MKSMLVITRHDMRLWFHLGFLLVFPFTNDSNNTELPRFLWGTILHIFPPLIISIKHRAFTYLQIIMTVISSITSFKTILHLSVYLGSNTSAQWRNIIFSRVCKRKTSNLSRGRQTEQGFVFSNFQPSFSVPCLSSFPRFYNDLHIIAWEVQSQQ